MSTKQNNQAVNTNLSKSANIGYSGKVTVSVQAGGKIISKKEYHNTGSISLFNFLCACLKGDYITANNLRPNTVKLFKVDTAIYDTPLAAKAYLNGSNGYTDSGIAFTGITSASALVGYNKEADVGVGDARDTVTLHFRVPYAFITNNSIYMIGLYRRNPAGDSN